MRTLVAAALIALLAVAAHAQGAGTRKGASPPPETQKKEDLVKKKADEQAYKDALKQIPEAKEKPDPWKTMR